VSRAKTPSRTRTAVHAAALLLLPSALWAAPSATELRELDRAFAVAGEAARTSGLDAARRELEPLLADDGPAATSARTLLGLLAHEHGEPATAALLLGDPGPAELEDWRLWGLAESLARTGRDAEARAALARLLDERPDSPLRPRVLVRRVELATKARDFEAARRGITTARAERLTPDAAVDIDLRAWELGLASGDLELLADAARRLLVADPLEASKRRLVDELAARDPGRSDWRLLLGADELLDRSAALLDADLPAGARTTLAAIPAEGRGLRWRVLEARALLAGRQGAEAWAVLRDARATTPREGAELAWWRSRAAAEAGSSRRGRAVSAADAERYRVLERENLLAVVRGGGAPELSRRALDRLADDDLEHGRVAEAIASWRQILELDPASTAGADPLWRRGWEAYRGGDPSAAIGLWRELVTLYPTSISARTARYWTARALEESGARESARELYLAILGTDVTDFYARQAALRLAGARPTAVAQLPTTAWPHDVRLARAERFTEIGLDALASTELELVGADADRRAVDAVAARALAHRGERRESLSALRRAFPELGTVRQGEAPAEALALFYPRDFGSAIERHAEAQALPPALVYAVIHQESAFDEDARSRSGAIGLMQIMPATGRELAHRLRLPFSTARLARADYSVQLGTRYLRQLVDHFDGRIEVALAGYNGGPGRIGRAWRAAGPDPELDRFVEGLRPDESRRYVKRILLLYESYRSLYSDLG